uniref:DNA-(apurinic or apyrimidinic site) endonuclease n=1 Tax=Culicoides sonorensis TaxID=179676 RepID=A0A336MTG9_CULSO
MAPAKGRGRPKKTTDAEGTKTEETNNVVAKSPAKSPAQNGAKKGRGRPAGTKKAVASPKPAKSPAKAKKEETVPEAKSATPTKRKAEDEAEVAPPAKSPKTDNASKPSGGRGRPKKAEGAAKKPAAKSPAGKKAGRGRPAAVVNGSPITVNVNVVVKDKKEKKEKTSKPKKQEVKVDVVVDKGTVAPPKKRGRKPSALDVVDEDEVEVIPVPKKRGRKPSTLDVVDEVEVTPVPKKRARKPSAAESTTSTDDVKESKKKRTVKEKKEKPEPKPKVNKTGTNYSALNFNLAEDKEFNLKISSWNVAGLRSWIEKNGLDFIEHEKPDILCLQETKCIEDQLPEPAKNIKGYHPYWLCKPGGHAGIAIYSKIMPYNVEYGIGDPEQDADGRIITAEYEKFFLVCTYVPNAGRKLVTLDKRLRWNQLFEAHLKKLDAKKPVIIAGDMNVAHEEIDLANPKTNKRNAGFTQEERDGMTNLLKLGFVDTFRHLYPTKDKAYTFWTYMMNARSKNVGWRLDYFLTSERLVGKVVDNVMRSEVLGSDHCPITLFLKL